MPDLLLELFSEEIPARMQVAAAKDLERLVVGALSDRGLLFEGAKNFSGPRRLVLVIGGLPAAQRDLEEERKGPRVGAPEKAIEGFLRSAGVTLEQCVKESDGKGEFYVARIKRTGRPTAEVLAEVLPEVFAKLPWPKSMRWPGSPVRWVRPLHAIVCTFDGEIVPFNFGGVESGRTTWGHRFLSQGPIEVRRYDDYAKKLRDAHVVLDADERRNIILHDMKQKTFAVGLEQIADEGLLQEVCGLAEWPVVYIGKIDDAFVGLPSEVLRTSMRTHQKYFALWRAGEEEKISHFGIVANTIATDGGKEIVSGNERVLRARLSDAKFFWDQDRKRTLESRLNDLRNIVFHAKLGTQFERVERIKALSRDIVEYRHDGAQGGADLAQIQIAATLCKSDLTTEMVREFPELQGVMGRYFALNEGYGFPIADAIRDHYKPLGPSDAVPTKIYSIVLALADKFDMLVGFFSINEKPTGSSDVYGLRRAALGWIRIILENNLRIPIANLIEKSLGRELKIDGKHHIAGDEFETNLVARIDKTTIAHSDIRKNAAYDVSALEDEIGTYRKWIHQKIAADLVGFLMDRLKVALRERGTRHDLIDAVFSLGSEDDLVRLVARVEALQTFLKTDDGANLLAGYRRAVNIVKAEEKKDKTAYEGEPDPKLLAEPEEIVLFREMAEARELIAAELTHERFTEAMIAMARLRGPVDAFFEKVTVNAPDPALRQNRLLLLSRLRASLHAVADFSKIEG